MNVLIKNLAASLALVALMVLGAAGSDLNRHETIGPTAGERIDWHTIAYGSGIAANTYHAVSGTVGQAAVGTSEAGSYRIIGGFWQDFDLSVTACCVGKIGDANDSGDDMPTIGDISVMIDAKFIAGVCITSGPGANIRCLGEADANLSGGIDPTCDDISIGDISMLIDDLFITGEPPFVRNNCAE